jgi:hypothetical protein
MRDLELYLDEIVDPTIGDLEQNPTSRRHAFIACVAVFHGIDYLAFPRSSRGLRQKFRKESPEFARVDQVAHAFKHVVAGGRQEPRLRAGDVIPRPPAYWDVSGAWDLSRWDDPVGGVTIDADRTVDLLDTLRRAAEFLRGKTAGEAVKHT